MQTIRMVVRAWIVVLAATAFTAASAQDIAGRRGSASEPGCGDQRWLHVYRPQRLTVLRSCITVTGTIVDATRQQAVHRRSGVRHERDGDTHGWLRLDPAFTDLLNAANRRYQAGNLVFEVVCHWAPRQRDAVAACANYADGVVLVPVGSHVAITGTLVMDAGHARWVEIHPVSGVVVR